MNRISQVIRLERRRGVVSFSDFPTGGEGPIYLRIVRFIREGVAAGSVVDGDEMPSRRVVSATLGVNPNTVQKAYRMLEEEGLIVSRSGAKSFACVTPESREAARQRLRAEELGRVISSLRRSGMEKSAAMELLSRLWDEDIEEGGEEE